jgi:predicted PurR-regulated permease PerM
MAEDTQLHMEKWTRLLVIVSAVLVLTIFVAVVVRLGLYIHHTILLFSLGALLAYALDPLVEGLRRRPTVARFIALLPRRGRAAPPSEPLIMSRPAAISIVFVGLLLLFACGVYGLGRPLANQVRLFTDKHQQEVYRGRARRFLMDSDVRLARVGVQVKLEQYLDDPASLPMTAQDFIKRSEEAALPFVRDVIVSAGESVIVLLIALYLLIYSGDMRRRLNAILPENLRTHAQVLEEDINRILGGYVRGQLVIALMMGAAAAIVCLILGIHIWLLIGIFVTVASLIPVFGPYIGAVPAVIAALVGPTHLSNNIVAALIVVAFFVIINEIGSKVLYPRLVGQAIGLHEVLVLFVIFAGLEIDGIPGVLFAAPVTAIAMVSLVHLYRFWLDLPDSLLSVRTDAVEPPADGPIPPAA